MKNRVILLLVSAVIISACGVRDSIKKKRMEEAEQAIRKGMDISHDYQKVIAQRDSVDVQKEYERRRKYFYALEGEFDGKFAPVIEVALPNVEPTGHQAVPKIHLSILVQHDYIPLPDTPAQTPEQIKSHSDALALSIEVTEVIWSADGTNLLFKGSCTQKEIKPDTQRGSLSVSCQSPAFPSGREYQFLLDDLEGHGSGNGSGNRSGDRSIETLSANAVTTSERLLEGNMSIVNMLNVRIMSPYAKEFIGQIERKGIVDLFQK